MREQARPPWDGRRHRQKYPNSTRTRRGAPPEQPRRHARSVCHASQEAVRGVGSSEGEDTERERWNALSYAAVVEQPLSEQAQLLDRAPWRSEMVRRQFRAQLVEAELLAGELEAAADH